MEAAEERTRRRREARSTEPLQPSVATLQQGSSSSAWQVWVAWEEKRCLVGHQWWARSGPGLGEQTASGPGTTTGYIG